MATKFKKGDEVKSVGVIPQGPVEAFSMDDDGNVFYLISWVDAEGCTQSRWFAEDALVAG